jgi:hypothetical protein
MRGAIRRHPELHALAARRRAHHRQEGERHTEHFWLVTRVERRQRPCETRRRELT